MRREITLLVLLASALAAASCGLANRKAPPKTLMEAATAQIPLDPEISPVSFRWLSSEAVLVETKTGSRALAGFGNYVCRAAGKSPRARLEIWDDEQAWKHITEGSDDVEEELAHKRAEYLKEADPEVVNRFMVFDRKGAILYQRDFRAWPLTSLD